MMPLAGPVVTAAQMRAAEVDSGIAIDELTQRAGAAVADLAWRLSSGAPILILCGPGNNGRDGFVAARLLAERGADVRVAASAPSRWGWAGSVTTLDAAEEAPVVIDALFGIGLSRPLDRTIAEQLARLYGAARLVLAVDLPSGVASDDGAILGAVGADVTLALGAAKPAHLLQPSAAMCARVLIADLGFAVSSEAQVLAPPRLSPPGVADHKYTRGLVVVVEGAMPGAAALTACAAARSGAGYVVLVGEGRGLPHAIVVRPAADLDRILADARIGAVVVGPGLGDDRDHVLARVLATTHPVVVDGDALRAGLPERAAPTILTPHAGEFTQMFGTSGGSKLDRTRAAAGTSAATVIFKGADTVIASPGGRATLAPAGPAWLATAGTGDVLSGVTGAMLARGLSPHDAAEAAVWLHAEAARRAGPALIADDLLGHLQAAVGSVSA